MTKSTERYYDTVQLVSSEDGSHTLFVPELNEHYHSKHGAIQEARHIFIDAGLKPKASKNKTINLLEVGFGTGLNALLSCIYATEKNISINYSGIEAYPLQPELIEQLNYAGLIENPASSDYFRKISTAKWGIQVSINDVFKLTKLHCKLQDFEWGTRSYDLVYFDAFSPDVQPELWEPELFRLLYEGMAKEGILVTYSCKGAVKRAMISAGFTIEKLPGPPGKREILRATKVRNLK